MEVIKFIGIICFTWLFTVGAAPIQFIKEFIGISNESQPKKTYLIVLQKLTNCSMCMGFWFGLAFYQNIWLACIISLTAEAFTKVANRLNGI